MKKLIFLLITLGIAVYCWFFFATPFEPYEGLSDVTWTRFSFFSYLLLPDEYFAAWVGLDGTVSLEYLFGVFTGAFVCFMAASGYGWLILSLSPFKFRREIISLLERWLLSIVIGLSFCSLIIFCFGFFGHLNNTKVIRPMTIIGIIL
ncbi:MAG: hypothetical protein LBL62_11995, partial [Planctomycetaceae bacterium]|nr:hypothetical protein [Planctomycetaceae bacterium]